MSNLRSRLANLKTKSTALAAKNKNKASDNILFIGDRYDKVYFNSLAMAARGKGVLANVKTIGSALELIMMCDQRGASKVLTTSIPLLKILLKWDKRKQPSLEDYSGSYFKIPSKKYPDRGIEIVFTAPLKQLVTKSYGKFLLQRNLSKLSDPDKWLKVPEFSWKIVDGTNHEEVLADLQHPANLLIGVDIETLKENTRIDCLSYTVLRKDPDHPSGFVTNTYVLELTDMFHVTIMRKLNWETKAPKVLQNGKYDIAYFARYNAPLYNYQYDTAMMFHSWYAELPKSLGFLNSFLIREAFYWKDLSETNDRKTYLQYCALDTWGTVMACVAMLLEMPDWAKYNYKQEFPLTFPCHMCEMRGIKRDMTKLQEVHNLAQAEVDKLNKQLNYWLGLPEGMTFNVASPKQMKELLKLLGCQHLKTAGEKDLKKAAQMHPFNARIIDQILKIRELRTQLSRYITPGKEFQEKDKNRMLYALNPHGTDTGRLASKEHHFWCGANIQNIPRGGFTKSTYMADEGFMIFEVDLSQAESRDTAYISGDPTLIYNVEESPDFHSSNASGFFGIPFEEIYDVANDVVLRKDLRQLGKPINHGANYNMGAFILVEQMGLPMIWNAKRLLGMPKNYGATDVAEALLDAFHKLYPKIRSSFHEGAVKEVVDTRKLQSLAQHHSWKDTAKLRENPELTRKIWAREYELFDVAQAWTRYCFKDPINSKPARNAYIAHQPQSLNGMTLNKSFLSVYTDIALNSEHSNNFKLLAQIHDSILGQVRLGHEYLIQMVVDRMEVPVTIRGYDNEVRSFVVPAEAKAGQKTKKGYSTYWSETE